jgi:hypothetical protein
MLIARLWCLLLGGTLIATATPGRSQDLVGCSLVDGQLSCVPGVSADPQAQIRALRAEIGATLAQESAVQQTIDGLEGLVLSGEASEGSLLRATVAADLLAASAANAFHWYRLSPGSAQWVWIESAQGPSYRLTAADLGGKVMLVVVRIDGDDAKRQATPAVGPVQPAAMGGMGLPGS